MSEDNLPENDERRTFMKGAAATGLGIAGLSAVTGSAAAQGENLRQLNLSVQDVDIDGQEGLVNLAVVVQNVRVIRDITLEDIEVTVIGGDVVGGDLIVDVIDDVDITFEDRVLNIENVDVDLLNDSVIQVAVAVLGQAGTFAHGSTAELVEGENGA